MNVDKSLKIAIYSGAIALIIGLITFTLSWNLWFFFTRPFPGYQFFLFPGNLTLIYFWHPLFTEEINFWPKLLMLLFGQFVVVTIFVIAVINIKKRLTDKKKNKT
jgi:hypothetical protein